MGIRNGLVCVLVGVALSACGGKPSNSTITETLHGAAQSGLKVDGFEVPSAAVKLQEIEVGAVQSVKSADGLDHYYVDGTATVILTGTGDEIAQNVETASRQAAESASLTNIENVVMGGAFGAAHARSALRDVIPGTGYKFPFEAILTKVDGDWRATEFRSKDGTAFATEQSRAIVAQRVAAEEAAAKAKAAEPKVSLLGMSHGYMLDETTGRAVEQQYPMYHTGDTLYAVVEVEAEPAIEAKAKAGHAARVSVRWHGPKNDEIVKKESFVINTAGRHVVTFALADTPDAGEYWPSIFIDAQDDGQANPGSFHVYRANVPDAAAVAAAAAEAAKYEQVVGEQVESLRRRDEARRVQDERQSAEDELEQRELARQRKEADALGRLQADHAAKLDAEEPIRK